MSRRNKHRRRRRHHFGVRAGKSGDKGADTSASEASSVDTASEPWGGDDDGPVAAGHHADRRPWRDLLIVG